MILRVRVRVVHKQCSWKRIRNDLGLLTGLPVHAVMHSPNYQIVRLRGALLKLLTVISVGPQHACELYVGTQQHAFLWPTFLLNQNHEPENVL